MRLMHNFVESHFTLFLVEDLLGRILLSNRKRTHNILRVPYCADVTLSCVGVRAGIGTR